MQKVVFVPLLESASDRFLFLPGVYCFAPRRAPDPLSSLSSLHHLHAFPFFFLEAQKSVPEVSIRKVSRRLSVFTLIARSDLLSVVKDIAGSVALSLTRVNWVSFSFSQQHRTDRIKKERGKSLSLSSKSQPTVYFMLFPFSTEPQTEWKSGKLYLLRSFSPKCAQVLSLFVPRAFYSSIIMTAGSSFQMFVKIRLTFSSGTLRSQSHSNYPV